MSRLLRVEFPGALYHVTARGDRREPIFEDDEDRRALLEVLSLALERFDASCLAYCLMSNHYHFVLETHLFHRAPPDEGVVEAYREDGYTQSAIAKALGLSVSRISRIIQAHEAKGKTLTPSDRTHVLSRVKACFSPKQKRKPRHGSGFCSAVSHSYFLST